MALLGETKFSERLRFFNGQRLFASDLHGLEELHREMRWLHNQSLHQPGVGRGYAVSGQRGDREIVIQPGYAIDAEGREIILTAKKVLQVPPVADDGHGAPAVYDLVVFYPGDEALKESETRAGICLSRGTIRLGEEPKFCWVKLEGEIDLQPEDTRLKVDLQNGMKIRLARAEVLNCSLYRKLSIVQRLNARPATRPYIACGKTKGQGWKVEEIDTYCFKLKRKVITSAAEFRSVPRYYAHVTGNREIKPEDGSGILIDGSAVIVDPSIDSFWLVVYVLKILLLLYNHSNANAIRQLSSENFEGLLNREPVIWQVEWIGVEG